MSHGPWVRVDRVFHIGIGVAHSFGIHGKGGKPYVLRYVSLTRRSDRARSRVGVAPVRATVKVRLVRKLAECIDGVDLSNRQVGEVLDLDAPDARLLIAHGWAIPTAPVQRTIAFDASRRLGAKATLPDV